MKIVDHLTAEDVIPELKGGSPEEVLREMAGSLASRGRVRDPETLVRVLLEREKLGSTGIGEGVAIPHGRLPGLDRILLAFGRSSRGVDFGAFDGKPVHLFFLLVAPEDSAGLHLKALARISRIVKSPDCRRGLLEAKGSPELFRVIAEEDGLH